jgi:hypothetical protein
LDVSPRSGFLLFLAKSLGLVGFNQILGVCGFVAESLGLAVETAPTQTKSAFADSEEARLYLRRDQHLNKNLIENLLVRDGGLCSCSRDFSRQGFMAHDLMIL